MLLETRPIVSLASRAAAPYRAAFSFSLVFFIFLKEFGSPKYVTGSLVFKVYIRRIEDGKQALYFFHVFFMAEVLWSHISTVHKFLLIPEMDRVKLICESLFFFVLDDSLSHLMGKWQN